MEEKIRGTKGECGTSDTESTTSTEYETKNGSFDTAQSLFPRRGSIDAKFIDEPLEIFPSRQRRWSVNPDLFHSRFESSFLTINDLQDKARSHSDQKLSARKSETCQHVKWADDCKKELVRTHPRKRYNKKPLKQSPLKPILKPDQTNDDEFM